MHTDACWYCRGNENNKGYLGFSWEFDTWVHMDCIAKAAQNTKDREAQLMAREFKHRDEYKAALAKLR